MRRITVLAAAALTAAALAAPAAHAESPPQTIVDVAVGASGGGTPDTNPYDYDILVQAVIAGDLAGTLASAGPFTVFAPDDQAFQRLAYDLTGEWQDEAGTLATIAGALTYEQLRNVLLYHVVAGRALDSKQLLRARELTMANGGTVRVTGLRLRDESTAFRNPFLVRGATTIAASNGVIHTSSRVLVPDPLG